MPSCRKRLCRHRQQKTTPFLQVWTSVRPGRLNHTQHKLLELMNESWMWRNARARSELQILMRLEATKAFACYDLSLTHGSFRCHRQSSIPIQEALRKPEN